MGATSESYHPLAVEYLAKQDIQCMLVAYQHFLLEKRIDKYTPGIIRIQHRIEPFGGNLSPIQSVPTLIYRLCELKDVVK